MAPLGRSLGASSPAAGTLGGGSLGTGPLGGGSLARGSLGGSSLGSSLGKSPLNGSLGTGSKGGLGSGGRFPSAGRNKDPFQQAPLGGIKDPPGVSKKHFLFHVRASAGCVAKHVSWMAGKWKLDDLSQHKTWYFTIPVIDPLLNIDHILIVWYQQQL